MKNRTIFIPVLLLLLPVMLSAQDKLDAVDLYRTGDYEGAIEVCRKELEEMPSRMDAHAVRLEPD